MKNKLVFLLVFVGLQITCSSPLFANKLIPRDRIRIAVFDVNATPPVGSRLTYDLMDNSDDLSLRAKGIVLLGSDLPIVLCSVDWIGIANESQDAFKEAIAEAAGTISNNVIVHSVHQHDAPVSDFTAEKILKENGLPVGCFDGTFDRELIVRLQEAVRKSLDNAREVTAIGMGSAEVQEVASNRRIYKENGRIVTMRGSSTRDPALRAMPEGLIDPEVSIISFWNNEKPLAVLSFYATHPQSYYLTKIANPDFPGIARYMRQLAVPDALHVHFSGAGGNIAAGKYNDGSHENRFVLATRLADGMKRAWENTTKYNVSSSDLGWNTDYLFLPYQDNVKEIEKGMQEGNDRFLANNMGKLGWYKRRIEGKGIEIACLRVKDARVLFMPGELFVEYQLAAKAMAPDYFVTMAAYGDYGPFYIGTAESYEEGGYEIQASPVTPESEKLILHKMERLLTRSMLPFSNDLLTYTNKEGNIVPITSKTEWDRKKERVLDSLQAAMGKLPRIKTGSFHVQYHDTLATDNYERYHISFAVAPFDTVFAFLYRPKTTRNISPAILALHSTGGKGKLIIDGSTSRKNRAYAKELAERGYVVISPDYPSMGESRDYDFENSMYASGTLKGVVNHVRCIDLLETLPYVNKEKIGVIGHSLGAHNAIFVAAVDPRLKVTVSSCGWTLMDYYNAGERVSSIFGGRLGPWAQERYMPYFQTRYGLDEEAIPFDFDELIATLAPRPFFSNSPVHDLNFSVEGVRKGTCKIRQVYRFMDAEDNLKVVYPEAKHDFPPETREEAYRFIDKYLK